MADLQSTSFRAHHSIDNSGRKNGVEAPLLDANFSIKNPTNENLEKIHQLTQDSKLDLLSEYGSGDGVGVKNNMQ